MNRGLLAKAWRESWLATLVLGMGLGLIEVLVAYALLGFQEQMSALLSQLSFVRRIFQTLLGANLSGRVGPEVIDSMAWVHPVVLAVVWAHAIIYCTRVPAGEVDRGTIDVLLGLPVSRWQLYCSESLVWIVSGIFVLILGAAGNAVGNLLGQGGTSPDPWRVAVVILNLFCLYWAVGGLSWFVSALSDHRGKAVAVVFAVLLGSFFLNFLAQFWSLAELVSFLSILHYYNPLPIIRDGLWPVRNMIVLLATGVVLWTAGGLVFARRDLATL